MATIKVVDLIDQAHGLLHDTGVRWPKPQLLDWFNAGQREVCLERPDALVVNGTHNTAVAAKQTLAAEGLRLIEVVSDATTNKGIRITDRDTLDIHEPDWQSVTGDPEQYVYDLRDPKTFYLYPHPALARNINIIYAKSPTVVTIANYDTDVTVLEIDDIYANAILDYMLYRSYIKDSKAGNADRGMAHYNAFLQSLGKKIQIDAALHPSSGKG